MNIDVSKIFISSSSQATLQPLRSRLKISLEDAGHKPIMYEYGDLGLYTDDPNQDCLNKVKDSDVLVLFISNKSGSFSRSNPNITITYAEFITALRHDKIVIPIVETHILQFYINHMKEELERAIHKYVEQHDHNPRFTYPIVKSLLQEHKEGDTVLHKKINEAGVEEFIWAFVHDSFTMTRWTYNYAIADTPDLCTFLLKVLSQVLRNSMKFYLHEKEITQNLLLYDELTVYQDSVTKFMKCLSNSVLNLPLFFKTLAEYLPGQAIYDPYSDYAEHPVPIVNISECKAITLYKRKGDLLLFVDSYGTKTPTAHFNINDEDSFVSQTYNKDMENDELLFYSEDKQMIYMTKKTGELVLSFHFYLSEGWSSRRVNSYEADITSAIMDKRQTFDFAMDLLGGMLNG
ncbi:DUF4062 domain-containing protein [Cytobacillus purgationiresistens]|uniref:DUF4062 domain-containing protein n=1 Tax=Cytobacillus purgationiresistens TaxID=863449 RepID=A0ABU0APC5_9BACI|nr:DUF4062 domain-containing protein [Cytobacillus purgationiresistens]MDQ0272617.1 hypothetical protein [Cytobacillus purgationiresistens]